MIVERSCLAGWFRSLPHIAVIVAVSLGMVATCPRANVFAAEAAKTWQPAETVSLGSVQVSLSKPVLVGRSKGYFWFPYMARLANGTLFATISTHGDQDIRPHRTGVVTWSDDGGLTWSSPVIPPGELYGAVSLPLGNGDHLLYPLSLYPQPNGIGSGYMVVSGKKGKHEVRFVKKGLSITGWPRPQRSLNEALGLGGFQIGGQTLSLPNGDHLATLYGYFQGVKRYSLVLAESRDGLNWKIRATIADEKCKLPGTETEGPCEAATVRLKDGRLMCVFRKCDSTPYGQTFSSDDGRTWTEPVSTTDPFSVRPSLAVMADGAVALSGGRPGLFLWLNFDGTGKDWEKIDLQAIHNAAQPEEPIADPIKTTSYTEVLAMDDSHLIIMYDRIPNGWNPIPAESTETNSIWVVRVTLTRP